jgi:hypothetical protein
MEFDKRAAKQQGVKEPSGYSGIEALLQYVYDQATSTNIYDQNNHILAVQAFHQENCVPYRDAESLNKDPKRAEILKECQAKVGPNTPGVETDDPSKNDAPPRQLEYAPIHEPTTSRNEPRSTPPAKRDENQQHKSESKQDKAPEAPKTPDKPKTPDLPKTPDVPTPPPVKIPDPGSILPGNPPPAPKLPDTPAGKITPPPVTGTSDKRSEGQLLDYLMGS